MYQLPSVPHWLSGSLTCLNFPPSLPTIHTDRASAKALENAGARRAGGWGGIWDETLPGCSRATYSCSQNPRWPEWGWFGVTVAVVISPSFLLITDITLYIYLFACLFSLLQWKFHKGRGLTFLLSLSVSPVPDKRQAHNRCSINMCGLVDRLTHPTLGLARCHNNESYRLLSIYCALSRVTAAARSSSALIFPITWLTTNVCHYFLHIYM